MNLFDYLERQQASFDEEPLNVADSAALALFCMVDAKGITPGAYEPLEGNGPLLNAAADRVHALGTDAAHFTDFYHEGDYDIKGAEADEIGHELYLLSRNPRFADLKIRDYAEVFDRSTHTQFAATTYTYRDEWAYVGFRGTDGSFPGWRENFDLAIDPPIRSQNIAVAYLNSVAAHLPDRIYVGGHSKGGNLATYAALNCAKPVQDRIACVFDLDSPGFKPGELTSDDIKPLEGRIIRMVPEEDVVGQLLDTPVEPRVVRSEVRQMAQHSVFTWQISDTLDDFSYAPELSDYSKRTHEIMDRWLASMSKDELVRLIDTVFEIVEASGVERVGQFFEGSSGISGLVLTIARSLDAQTVGAVLPALVRFGIISTKVRTRDVPKDVQHARANMRVAFSR